MEPTDWEWEIMPNFIEDSGSALPTGGSDTLPPSLASLCNKLGFSESAIEELTAELINLRHDLAHVKPKPEDVDLDSYFITDDADRVEQSRRGRKFEAERFTMQYNYGRNIDGCNDNMEQRTCIWSDDTCLWSEISSGIMWVGVHGADSVCVVTSREDLDMERVRGNLTILTAYQVLVLFRKTIISKLEDLADPSSKLRQRFDHSIKKPFGVVSANPGTNGIHKESGHEAPNAVYDEKQAVKFLQEKMKCDTDFTVTETKKTAIRAFQCLFQNKLKATEIGVSVVHPKYFVPSTDKYRDATVEELDISEIQKYLAVSEESGPEEIEEHSVVINDTGTPCKKQRTSLVPESHVHVSSSGNYRA